MRVIEKIHIIVAIFAALAITILSLYQDVSFYDLSKRLVIVIPLFFVFGLFFRMYLKKLFAPPKPPAEASAEKDGEQKEAGAEEGQNTDDLFDDSYDEL